MTLTVKSETLPQHSNTHTHTSEKADRPPPAPAGPPGRTDKPQSMLWSLPSETADLSVG